jgi:hypothetical protein
MARLIVDGADLWSGCRGWKSSAIRGAAGL